MRIKSAPLLIAPLLLLAACEEDAPVVEAPATGGDAAGEVLGGTISDDMLPLEELTSTSPPAAPTSTGGSGAAESAEPAGETAEAEAAPAAPAPDESADEE